jgi:hypothetical protein
MASVGVAGGDAPHWTAADSDDHGGADVPLILAAAVAPAAIAYVL